MEKKERVKKERQSATLCVLGDFLNISVRLDSFLPMEQWFNTYRKEKDKQKKKLVLG